MCQGKKNRMKIWGVSTSQERDSKVGLWMISVNYIIRGPDSSYDNLKYTLNESAMSFLSWEKSYTPVKETHLCLQCVWK